MFERVKRPSPLLLAVLLLLAVAGGSPVSAQSYTTFDWPNNQADPNVYNSTPGVHWSATYYNGSVYLANAYLHIDGSDNNNLDLMKLDVGNNGVVSNLQRVGQVSSDGSFVQVVQPATIVFNDLLYIFYTAVKPSWQVWYTTYDGANWAKDQKAGNATAVTTNYLAAAILNGKLYVFYQWYGTWNGVVSNWLAYVATSDGVNWDDAVAAFPIPSDLRALAAATYFDPVAKISELMIALAVNNGNSLLFYNYDGTTFSKMNEWDSDPSYSINDLALVNGTVQGDATEDSMQIFVQRNNPNAPPDLLYYRTWNRAEWTIYDGVWYNEQTFTNGIKVGGGVWATVQGLSAAVIGAYDTNSQSMRQYFSLIGMASHPTTTSMQPFAYTFTSDLLKYDPAFDQTCNVSDVIGANPNNFQGLLTSVQPLGYVMGMPPFTYNGRDPNSKGLGSLSILSLGTSDTNSVSTSTTWEGSLQVGASYGCVGAWKLGMTAGVNLSHSTEKSSSITKSKQLNFTLPDSTNTMDNSGKWGFFFYQAPTLVHNLYKRFAWDGSTRLQPDFHYVYVTDTTMNYFSFLLSDPSQTDPAGFGYFTQGIPPLWSSTDLGSWTEHNGEIAGWKQNSNSYDMGTMNMNGPAQQHESVNWTTGETDTSEHEYSLDLQLQIGPFFDTDGVKASGSATFKSVNSKSATNGSDLYLTLPSVSYPAPVIPTYTSYMVDPVWMQPKSGATAPWLPVNCSSQQSFFALAYIVDAQQSNSLITLVNQPANFGTATAEQSSMDQDGTKYKIKATPSPSGAYIYVFSHWSGDASKVMFADSTDPETIATLTADATVTANFAANTPTYPLNYQITWEGGTTPTDFGSITPAQGQAFKSGDTVVVDFTLTPKYVEQGFVIAGVDLVGDKAPIINKDNTFKSDGTYITFSFPMGTEAVNAVFTVNNPNIPSEYVTLTVQTDNGASCRTSAKQVFVRKGALVPVSASTSRPGAYALGQWTVKSGEAYPLTENGRTSVYVLSDAVVRAEWQQNQWTQAQLDKIALQVGKGGVTLKHLPFKMIKKDFLAGLDGSLLVEGALFDLGVLKWKRGDKIATINVAGDRLVLDFITNTLEFTSKRKIHASVITSDGFLVKFKAGGQEHAYVIPCEEFTAWDKTDPASETGLISASCTLMSKFKKHLFSLEATTGQELEKPAPWADAFTVRIGKTFFMVLPQHFKNNGGVYTYGIENALGAFSLTVDTNKETVALEHYGWSPEDFDLFKGIWVEMSSGNWKKSFWVDYDKQNTAVYRSLIK